MAPNTDNIFKKRFPVTIPTYATINSTVTERGIPTTGIPGMDEGMYRAPLKVYATINEQLHYWQKGYYVRIAKVDVATEIYTCIQNYLQEWITLLQKGSGNHIRIPKDDLAALDSYADSIHRILYSRNAAPVSESDILRALNPMKHMADRAIAKEKMTQRQPLSDFFGDDFMDKRRI